MTTGILHDQNLEKQIEKQMGCMAGFFQLFDRNQILTGKRVYATKRLPSPVAVDATTESEKSVGSPPVSTELDNPQQSRAMTSSSPDRLKASPGTESEKIAPVGIPAKMALHLPVFESKEGSRSSWKFSKEAPRLSLDSRATVDAKGKLYAREIRTNASIISANRSEDSGNGAAADGDDKRRSPSVIAKLMGLEPLPDSNPEPMKNPELRRSASESRVSRDLFQHRFMDGNNFQQKQQNQLYPVGRNVSSNAAQHNAGTEFTKRSFNGRQADPMEHSTRYAKSESPKPPYRGVGTSPWKSPQQRRSFFDSEDFFPGPKQTVSIYGDIEKRLKMRGIDEPAKDLETLMHILEALQLKGLLHSKKPSERISQRNFVYDRSFSSYESPIVVMKPSRSPVSPIHRRFANDLPPSGLRSSAGVRRNVNPAGENFSSVSPRRERLEIDRNGRNQARAKNSSSPTRRENNAKSSILPARRRSSGVEMQRKANDPSEQRRASPVHSPKLSPRRIGSDQTNITRSPRNRAPTADIDPKQKIAIVLEDESSSSISETSVSTPSQTDTERSKREHREGRSLLERCDKLLHSIMEITATELQPSPVSVLDSSFYKDDSSSPSPVLKRSIDFKDLPGEFEDDIWSSAISLVETKCDEKLEDCDFVYISEILRASDYLPEDSDIFQLLEKQQYLKGRDTSKVSKLQRKLIYDTVTEILDRNRQLPPWKVVVSWSNSCAEKLSLRQIWSEFRRIRELDTSEDLFDTICCVLRKDLAEDAVNGWGDCPMEMSEAVLDIERLIFKDLIGETIRDLAAVADESLVSASPRRKLIF